MRFRKTDEASDVTPQQEEAIPALLASPSIPKAAEQTGVSKATLWRWMKEPAFAEAYRQARKEVVGHATSRLQHMSSEAAQALHEVATDPSAPHAARVSVARAMLDMAVTTTHNQEFEAWIANLEGSSDTAGGEDG